MKVQVVVYGQDPEMSTVFDTLFWELPWRMHVQARLSDFDLFDRRQTTRAEELRDILGMTANPDSFQLVADMPELPLRSLHCVQLA